MENVAGRFLLCVQMFRGTRMNFGASSSPRSLMPFLYVILLLLVGLAGGAWAADRGVAGAVDGANAGASVATGNKTILVWGDSLSAAFGFEKDKGWPTLLSEKLASEGFSVNVINGSVAGETTAGGLARLPRALETHQPEYVLLALGANDGLRALPPKAMKAQLGKMIGLSQAQGAEVLLFEMKIPPNYGPRYSEAFENVFHELAAETAVSLVPFFLLDVALAPEYMQSDNLHPTAEAQPLLLNRIWPVLKQTLVKQQ